MKSTEIKKELDRLEEDLRGVVKKSGASEISRIVELPQSDVAGWLSRQRNWTYNKILKIAEKLGL